MIRSGEGSFYSAEARQAVSPKFLGREATISCRFKRLKSKWFVDYCLHLFVHLPALQAPARYDLIAQLLDMYDSHEVAKSIL